LIGRSEHRPTTRGTRELRTPRRAQARQRGSVLVEAAVVIPVFVILFAGMLFLHHVIREQQRVGARAKDEAWTSAMNACSGGAAGLPKVPFSSTMPNAPGSDITLQDSVDTASASASSFVWVSVLGNGPPAAAQGGGLAFSQAVGAHADVFCNNQTARGDIGGVLDWLIANVKGLFGW
jgi:hypothetical protein